MIFKFYTKEELAGLIQLGKKKPYYRWLALAVLMLSIGLVMYFSLGDKHTDQVEYITDTVKVGRIAVVVSASGNIMPTNQVVIGSELSGTMSHVYVDTNDAVHKGQPLAKLDTSKLDIQADRARAALLSARARVSQARATVVENKAIHARHEELFRISGGKTPSKAVMDTSIASMARGEADLESANASVVGAESEVKAIERDLKKATMTSPVDGVVLSRTADVGQTVAASFTAPTLFAIAEDLRKMKLLVSIKEADIGRVVAEQTATFKVDAWPFRTYSAKVKKVAFGSSNNQGASGSNTGAAATGVVTYTAELEVINEDLSLRPGMTAAVDIAVQEKNEIKMVSNAALRFNPNLFASIGKADESKRNLVQSLSTSNSRRMKTKSTIPRSGSEVDGPRVFQLQEGQLVETTVVTGISDGRYTELINDSLAVGACVVVNTKPKPQK